MINYNLPSLYQNANLDDEDGFIDTYSREDDLVALQYAVKELIDADCHAVVMDGEIIYNTYQEMSHREHILEHMIREQLVNDVHRHLFSPLFRKNRNFLIEIYMFRNDSWKIDIHFNHQTKLFTVSKKQ